MPNDNDSSPADRRLKSGLVYFAVISAFSLGLYSLFLASVNTGEVKPLAEKGLIRTATAKNTDQIGLALGAMVEPEVVYVVVDDPLGPPDRDLERNAQRAAQNLVDSGLVASVRRLEPDDPDYATIVEQNMIGRFPTVLVVKKNGGIILVTGDYSSENLVHAFHAVWGKKSDCGVAKNAVY